MNRVTNFIFLFALLLTTACGVQRNAGIADADSANPASLSEAEAEAEAEAGPQSDGMITFVGQGGN